MDVAGNLIDWTMTVLASCSGWLAARNYLALPALDDFVTGSARGERQSGLSSHGHVAVVIPARNECGRLPALLSSLAKLEYPDYDILVVDDGSTDDTPQVAESHGVRVVTVAGPEPGWTGKSFACWTGALSTQGEWLLFTDADTIHAPRSLSLALAAATRADAALTSLLAQQRCETFWERVLLPYAYALYFVGAWHANQSHGPAIANGQYLLFRRPAYEKLGGHEAVWASLIEDVALASEVVRAGGKVLLLRGERHLEVRMYAGLGELWQGFAKNSVRFVAATPRSGIWTVLAGILLSTGTGRIVRGRSLRSLLTWLGPAAGMAGWQRRFGVPGLYALLWPLAAVTFQVIALDAIHRQLRGRTVWKGRSYQ